MSDSHVSNSLRSRIDQLTTDTATGTKPLRRVIRTVTGAGEPAFREDAPPSGETVPAGNAYPHLFDEAQSAGRAMHFVFQALEDANGSLREFGEGDLSAVQTKLGLVASQLAAAYNLIDFNRDFANVLAFLRRATLSVSASEVDREMLNALVSAIRMLTNSPTISLMDAAKLTQTLEAHRWSGSISAVDKLLRSLLKEPDAEQQPQGDMFENYPAKVVGAQS